CVSAYSDQPAIIVSKRRESVFVPELTNPKFIVVVGLSEAEPRRMKRLFVAIILSGWLALPALGATLDAAAINNAELGSKHPAQDKIDAIIVQAQVLLDRAQFSPGEIDGKLGENAQKALRAFAEAKGLASDKALTPEVWTALARTSNDPVIAEYRISENDVKGPFLEKLPAKMEDMKSLK